MTDGSPVRYIAAITDRYQSLGYTPYRWFQATEDPPLVRPTLPLSRTRIGVLATSGAYVAGQVAYHYKDDTSLREIPVDTPRERVRFAHITENYLAGSRQDPDCTLPLGPLRALRDSGVIGALPSAVLSCMGGIYSQRRVLEELLPAVAERFREQEVDAALLIPM